MASEHVWVRLPREVAEAWKRRATLQTAKWTDTDIAALDDAIREALAREEGDVRDGWVDPNDLSRSYVVFYDRHGPESDPDATFAATIILHREKEK